VRCLEQGYELNNVLAATHKGSHNSQLEAQVSEWELTVDERIVKRAKPKQREQNKKNYKRGGKTNKNTTPKVEKAIKR
jgi:hypothetical protein